MKTISRSDLHLIPYIDFVPNDGRIVTLGTFFHHEDNCFKVYAPFNQNELREMTTLDLLEGIYFSKNILCNDTDYNSALINLLYTRATFPELRSITKGIINDILNFCAVINKFSFLHSYFGANSSDNKSTIINRVYNTEVEYLLGLVRSYFDLLFEVLKRLFKIYKLPELPNSLGKIIDNDLNITAEKYKFNSPLIEFFEVSMPLFSASRKFRDDIYHRGKDSELIFNTSNGPGVSIVEKPFSSFHDIIWNNSVSNQNLLPNDIGSLYFFILKIVDLSLEATELFSTALITSFEFPKKYTNDYDVFLRSPLMKKICDIKNLINNYWITSVA